MKIGASLVEGIQGLYYIPNFLSEEEEEFFTKVIDVDNESKWSGTGAPSHGRAASISRRTQHYGYEYNYALKDANKYLGKLPDWAIAIRNRLAELKSLTDDVPLIKEKFNQVIVNEYLPGQGIGAHIDHTKFFGDEIVSISMGSDIVMEFEQRNFNKDPSSQKTIPVLLERRCAVIMTEEARYEWTHAIKPRKYDIKPSTDVEDKEKLSALPSEPSALGTESQTNGVKFERKRRVSMTFRRVI